MEKPNFLTEFPVADTSAPKMKTRIFDTTLRDGEQSVGAGMSKNEKKVVAEMLAYLGVNIIEAGFPASNSDRIAVREIADITETINPEMKVAALSTSRERELSSAIGTLQGKANGMIHTFISTSPEHIKHKLGMNEEQVLSEIGRSVRQSKESGLYTEWSAEDATRTGIEFLWQAVREAVIAGADTINLPDTVGHGNPDIIRHMFHMISRAIYEEFPEKDIIFSAHNHNDHGTALPSSIAALQGVTQGAKEAKYNKLHTIQVEGTVGGFGERAGNVPLEQLIAYLNQHSDTIHPEARFVHDVNTGLLIPTAHAIFHILGQKVPERQPIIGTEIALHGAGIHGDGDKKGKKNGLKIYNPFDVSVFGGEDGEVRLGTRAGAANVISALAEWNIYDDSKEGKEQASSLLKAITKEAELVKRVFPAHVLRLYSEQNEGLSNIRFHANGNTHVEFTWQGEEIRFEAPIKEGNSAIQGLIEAISQFTETEITIAEQAQQKRDSLKEIISTFREKTGHTISTKITKDIPGDAEALALSYVRIVSDNYDHKTIVESQNISEGNLLAIFTACWPMIREKLNKS